MKRTLHIATALLLTPTLALSLNMAAFAAEGPSQSDYEDWDTIKVFETTDIHGYITDISSFEEDTFQYRMAYLAQVFNTARASDAYDDVLLLDGGDTFQGTPHSNLTYGAALRAAIDIMDYDAVSLGNHEFDWDVTKYGGDANGTMAPYELGSYKGDSDIPVLAYNLHYAGTTDRVSFVQEYTVVEKAGYTIAILGYIPDYTFSIMAARIDPYDIDEDLGRLADKAKEVREVSEADALVILAHGDPIEIAEAMDPEVVDLVAGGHTHRAAYGTTDSGIAYIQGASEAEGYAAAEMKINPETKEVAVINPEYMSIIEDEENLYYQDGKNTLLDSDVVAISMAAWDAVKDEMTEPLGYIDTNIYRNDPVAPDSINSSAGNWITSLMLEATKDLNTVAAFANHGGIRTDIVIPDGATTRGIAISDIYTISPFANRILTFTVSGRQLADQLELAFSASNYGDQFSGIHITYRNVGDGGIEVTSIVTDDGEVIDINGTEPLYNICTYEFCSTLEGSPLENLTPIQPYNDAPIDNLSAIEALRTISAANGGKIPVDTTSHMTLDTSTPTESAEPAAPAESPPPAESTTYVVVSGDCLWNIARRFYGTGTRWGDIYEANQGTIKNPSSIYIGQVLVIPKK